jgi:predicted O-methyltransferase YrrM
LSWAKNLDQADFVQLQAAEALGLIAAHQTQPPAQVALALHKTHPHISAQVATQVALRQAVAHKLPEFVAAGCLLLREPAEQATHQAVASGRGFPKGRLAVDLTAGLGADTLALAGRFDAVVAVEPDPMRAVLLRYNLGVLGVRNVSVTETTAESWLDQNLNARVDFVFIDPARRTDKNPKAIRLADCAPDVLGLLPQLRVLGAETWVKLSPLFEASEAHALPGLSGATAFSLEGEVKEVMLKFYSLGAQSSVVATSAQGIWQRTSWELTAPANCPEPALGPLTGCILLPDAAIEKMKLVDAFCEAFGVVSPRRTHPQGYLSCAESPRDFLPSRVLAIADRLPYKPDALKKQLPKLGYGAAVVHVRDFDLSAAEVRKRLQVAEGVPVDGEPYPRYILATRAGAGLQQSRWVYLCRRLA